MRNSKTICAIGDSLTFNAQYSPLMCDFYPEQLAALLRTAGYTVRARNFGNAGERTSQMLQRIRCVTQFETPEIAIIFGGANDPGGGGTASTLTRVGTTATFTAGANHNLATGDVVTISGSNLSQFNVANAVVTVTSAIVFTYTIPSDPGANSAGTPRFDHQTQANIEAMIIALRNGVSGMVGTQAALPSGATAGTRYIVRYDTSTTGGLSGTSPATLTGTQSGAQIWIARNSAAGELGWSRMTADNTGIPRIVVMSMHWLHYVSGAGDTLATPYATYATVRTAQQAAAVAQGWLQTPPTATTAQAVTFFDLYTYQRNLIVNGYEGELTGYWAANTNDQHPSAYAGYTWANGLLAHIQAQYGWTTALATES